MPAHYSGAPSQTPRALPKPGPAPREDYVCNLSGERLIDITNSNILVLITSQLLLTPDHIRTMQCCAMKWTRKWFNTSSTASRATGSMCSTWGSSRPSSTRSRSSLGGVKTWSCRWVPAWNERFLFKCEQPPFYQELVNAGEDVLIFYNDKVIFHPVPSFGAAFSFSSIHCPLLGRLALFFFCRNLIQCLLI